VSENGVSWTLPGDVSDALRRGRKIEAIKLLRVARGLGLKEAKEAVGSAMFPSGSELEVGYNPDVTGTRFQHRTLRVPPYVPDLRSVELRRIGRWGLFGVGPFVFLSWLGFAIRRRRAECEGAPRPLSRR